MTGPFSTQVETNRTIIRPFCGFKYIIDGKGKREAISDMFPATKRGGFRPINFPSNLQMKWADYSGHSRKYVGNLCCFSVIRDLI